MARCLDGRQYAATCLRNILVGNAGEALLEFLSTVTAEHEVCVTVD